MKMGHIDMASLEKKLSVKLKRNEDSVVPKTNITIQLHPSCTQNQK
jgi:hypothetical protein